ncbi:hypothetical protein [Halorubrum halophilum]|nr:hypothetical protein [Halorubrum halophilum]
MTHLAVALAALALLGAGAGLATAQTDGPAVSVTDADLSASGTATVDVVLTSAPNGLAGYNIDLTVDDPNVAHIESASYPDRFDLTTDPAVGDEGRTVTLEAADMGSTIDAGASDVTLATVEIAGDAPGEAELAVEPQQVDTNDGDRIQPAAQAGALTVTGDSSASATESADPPSAGPVDELGGSADALPTDALALLGALVAIVALSALAVARRRS